ncbi:MAG: UDP-3-O-(3-hydroxymyristoyl)glucosamine N-acyltransferase [Cocleimonas sp.]|nr:UDP-3-O-(3-hydroxymyristoyl)glucosamine N-acyltransferase [Cocleimonas sp.]
MILTLEKLAELTESKVKGDGSCQLQGVMSLEEAGEGQISFVSNPKYKKHLEASKASAVVLSPVLAKDYSGNALINDDPYLTFAKTVSIFHTKKIPLPLIHPSAVIADSAVISKQATIAANVVIEPDVVIEDEVIVGAGSFIGERSVLKKNVQLYPNVTLNSDTKVGKNSIIHSGAVIGADGFGFAPQKDKSWYKILQVGNVIIGSDVEIGANTTIDRAALGSTEIANGVKLDNQIQVGHNVSIGEHTIIAGGALIAGSTQIGKTCQIGGAAAIGGHLKIADNVIISGRAMVISSINEAGVYSSGIVIEENKKWRRNAARFRQLDEMAKTIKRLEKKLEEREEGGLS